MSCHSVDLLHFASVVVS